MNLSRINVWSMSRKLPKCKHLWPFIISKQCISFLGKWKQPEGHDTGIAVYNSAVNQKVPLILKKKDLLTWYMCGPTVYAESHIGHASCYVKFDIIRRILESVFNINVLLLLGITDIDDKIIKKANEVGLSASQLAKKYELDFFEDMDAVKILPPTVIGRVSENIPLIIAFCEKLIEKDYAYVTSEEPTKKYELDFFEDMDAMKVLPPTVLSRVSKNIPLIIAFCEKLIEKDYAYVTSKGNVYFIVSKGGTSDVLNEVVDDSLRDVHIDPLKKDPRDFALWKAAKPNEPFWESPWGKGRPGWHIECSAIASKMFGSEMDVHSGGADLLFPHHSNELSQSNAYHSCSQWVHYWLHAGLLHVDDDSKMSKSIGNTISIKDFLREHYVNDFRILCLQCRYRKNLLYNSETLSGAKFLHKKIHNFMNHCDSYICGEIKGPPLEEDKLLLKLAVTKEQVITYLKNDFNTSNALVCLTDFIDEINKNLPAINTSDSVIPSNIATISSCYMYVKALLEILGVIVTTKKNLPRELVFSLDSIVGFRNKIRLFALNPKAIGISTSSYVDNMYKAMLVELDMNYENEIYPKFMMDLLDDSKVFYKKAHQFSETFETNGSLALIDGMTAKERKKIMGPLFVYCDNFRSVLNDKGISIKDRGNTSSWMPLIELQKILFNSYNCK